MRSILFLLIFSYLIACGVPSNPKDPEPIDPYQLSCGEAVERFTTLAKQADLSCQKDSDCISLGSWIDCDCLIQVRPGSYPIKNQEIVALHDRIFDNRSACIDERALFCKYHHLQFISLSKPTCKEGQCSSQTDQKQECPSSSNTP